jgi:hypothetical protein
MKLGRNSGVFSQGVSVDGAPGCEKVSRCEGGYRGYGVASTRAR